jgi:hypothetical protein
MWSHCVNTKSPMTKGKDLDCRLKAQECHNDMNSTGSNTSDKQLQEKFIPNIPSSFIVVLDNT